MAVSRGKKRRPTPWSHEALERRGYRKCPFSWRHLVKLEDHIRAHNAGVIGPDGRRRDRSQEERKRWLERYRRPVRGAQPPRQFVPRSDYERVLGIFSADIHEFRRQIDGLVSQEP